MKGKRNRLRTCRELTFYSFALLRFLKMIQRPPGTFTSMALPQCWAPPPRSCIRLIATITRQVCRASGFYD